MFIDRIVNKVYEIEYASIKEYKGNYTDFEKQKRIDYEKQLKDFEYQQAEIKRLKSIADRFRYKPTKAKMALSKLKKIEQMTIVQEPNKYDLKTFHANFGIQTESGKMVLKVRNLDIGYNNPLAEVSFSLYRGQKLAVIGENGIGKSTLLKTLNGNIPKINGDIEYGHNVNIGYFDQQMEFRNTENTVFDDVSEAFPNLTTTQIRTLLGTFLFSGEDVFKKINVLSGGEKSRLQLCKILKKGPNLLLLDEPTNHMDIVGKESLEQILKEYKGTLIFVSHDRYFVNKIADSILEFENGKVTFFDGNYEEYTRHKEEVDEDNEKLYINKKDRTLSKENIITSKDNKKENNINKYLISKQNNKIKNKMDRLEKEIEEKENEIEEINKEMLKEGISTDYLKLNDLHEQIKVLQEEIELKMEEWENLSSQYIELK